jgi:hypothetical protein
LSWQQFAREYECMVKRFIISIEICVELIFIVSAVATA